jgi:hypothetical protein
MLDAITDILGQNCSITNARYFSEPRKEHYVDVYRCEKNIPVDIIAVDKFGYTRWLDQQKASWAKYLDQAYAWPGVTGAAFAFDGHVAWRTKRQENLETFILAKVKETKREGAAIYVAGKELLRDVLSPLSVVAWQAGDEIIVRQEALKWVYFVYLDNLKSGKKRESGRLFEHILEESGLSRCEIFNNPPKEINLQGLIQAGTALFIQHELGHYHNKQHAPWARTAVSNDELKFELLAESFVLKNLVRNKDDFGYKLWTLYVLNKPEDFQGEVKHTLRKGLPDTYQVWPERINWRAVEVYARRLLNRLEISF